MPSLALDCGHPLQQQAIDNKVNGANMGPTWVLSAPSLFFESLYLPIFYMNTLTTLHFAQQISKLRTQSRHYPNTIATNGAGVCQYDITNATANYNAVSMTTPDHHFKDNLIIIAT